MASISKYGKGCRRIQFVAPDGSGQRPSIYLGKISQRAAEGIKYRVEQLLECINLKQPMSADLAQWVKDLEPWLAEKLAAVELIADPEAKPVAMLGAFLSEYIAGRTDVKPLTTRHLNDSRRYLVTFFGENKPLGDITPGDADDFRRWLLQRLGENTVRRLCGRAKQFFRAAARKHLLRENPFGDMSGCGVRANHQRDYFVTRAQADAALEACPDSEWRLLFALSRFGGLRCPSEHLALRWADVDWANGRLTVTSSKTAHHEGGASRVIPLFPELRPHLEACWDQAAERTEFVITRYRDTNANLRTTLTKIIRRAGLEPWPKLFQNLRASRATELAAEHPAHVAAAWLGHSILVANKHYWQVTDDDFRQATDGDAHGAQIIAQSAHEMAGNDQKPQGDAQKETPVFQGFAEHVHYLPYSQVPPDGLEPSTL